MSILGPDGAPESALDAPFVEVRTEERVWRFDRTFVTSNWNCIWGRGCRGMHVTQDPSRADGCCTEGAALTDAEDFLIVSNAAAQLTPPQWQHAASARRTGWFKRLPNGVVGTRVVDGACIFHNRPGFAGGTGCALHLASIERGERPIDGKPNICWQFPLRRTEATGEDSLPVSTIGPWRTDDWKARGGRREWFCTAAPEAYDAPTSVWRTLEAELREIVGDHVYERLAVLLASPGELPAS